MGELSAEELARKFHETYERLAPEFGYETRKESAVPWEEVPEQNRRLMTAVCQELIDAKLVAVSGGAVDGQELLTFRVTREMVRAFSEWSDLARFRFEQTGSELTLWIKDEPRDAAL